MSEPPKFKVVPVEEGDSNRVRICSSKRQLPDDLEGQCDECKHEIFYRPEPPYLCRKICGECGGKLIDSGTLGEIQFPPEVAALISLLGITPEEFLAEAKKHYLKK